MGNMASGFASSSPAMGQLSSDTSSFGDSTSSAMPAVLKPSPNRGAPSLGASSSPQARSLLEKGQEFYEIPAFLRKQAD